MNAERDGGHCTGIALPFAATPEPVLMLNMGTRVGSIVAVACCVPVAVAVLCDRVAMEVFVPVAAGRADVARIKNKRLRRVLAVKICILEMMGSDLEKIG